MNERDDVQGRGPASILGVRDKGMRFTAADTPPPAPPENVAADWCYLICNKEVVVDKILTVPANTFTKVKLVHLPRTQEYARRLRAEYYTTAPGMKPKGI